MTPQEFLHTLYDNFDDGYISLFSIDAGKSRHVDWFAINDLDAALDTALAMRTRDVWFGVATRTAPAPDGRRGGDTECAAIPGLWLDIDIAGPNHKDSFKLPTNMDEARRLLAQCELRPSLVVDSGGGLHCYWLLDEPTGAEAARTLLARWAATWNQHADAVGLRVDNVFDLPRVLRVPGTINHKQDAGAIVRVIADQGHVYSYSDIVDATIEPPMPVRRERTGVPLTGSDAPGVDFNARHTGGYVLDMAGWAHSETERNGNEKWLHPWSPSSDCSATVYADDGHTTIWSDTAVARVAALDKHRPYDPFGLYTVLMHDGDFSAAAKELVRLGYGGGYSLPEMQARSTGVAADVEAPPETIDGKITVITGGRHLDDLVNDVVAGLVKLNDPETMFRHGDSVAAFQRGTLEPVDRVRLMNTVEVNMRPLTMKRDTFVPSRVDATALDLTLLRLLDELPAIDSVLHAPFLRANGTVCTSVGYDPTSRCYLTGTMPIDVPDAPTCQQIAKAVGVIDEFLCDFPLSTPSDRSHIFGLLLTLLTRHLVPLSPMFVLDGNGPGVGKNLLSECCVYIATGEWVQTDPLPLDNEEQRKQITALMSEGRSIALFDEAHIIGGTSLARLITSTSWGDRLLGYSRQVNYPNTLTVIGLGNNVEITGDLPRRCIVIRMASQVSRPELRSEFRHDDLRAWVTTNRATILEALLTILRGWVAAGRPPSNDRLGSFDAWAALIGGALRHAGIDGFLANAEEMRSRSATDDADMEAHFEELYEIIGDGPFSVRKVAQLIEAEQLDIIPPKVSPSGARLNQQLGHIYRRYSERWVGDWKVTQGGLDRKARQWVLEKREQPVDNSGGLRGLGGPVNLKTKANSYLEWGGEQVPPPSVADSVSSELESSPPSPLSPPPSDLPF